MNWRNVYPNAWSRPRHRQNNPHGFQGFIVSRTRFALSFLVETNLQDLELHRSLGDGNLDLLTNFLADETLCQGARDQNLARVVVFVPSADQLENFLIAKVEVLDDDGRAENDFILGQGRGIDDPGPAELVAQHIDLGLQHALRF